MMFDVSLPSESDAAQFSTRMESILFDGVMLSRSISSAQKYHRGQNRILADSIDHYMFQIFDRGHVDMDLGLKTVRAERGTMIAGDMTEVLKSENSDYALISAFIPRQRMDPHLHNSGMIHGALIDSTTGAGRLLGSYMQTLWMTGQDMSEMGAKAASEALILLIAAACNQVHIDQANPPEWANHSLLLRARAEIAKQVGDSDLNAEMLAGLLGLSRARLYRLFKPYGGVMHIVREQRLRRALSDLVSPRGQKHQISEIAYRCGFSSPAQFSRAFRARYGCSPKEARAEGRLLTARQDWETTLPFGDRKFEYWIETLA